MLRLIKGLVIAFAISFLITLPTTAQAAGNTPAATANVPASFSATAGVTVTNYFRGLVLESDTKADPKQLAEAKRQADLVKVEFITIYSALICFLLYLIVSTYYDNKR